MTSNDKSLIARLNRRSRHPSAVLQRVTDHLPPAWQQDIERVRLQFGSGDEQLGVTHCQAASEVWPRGGVGERIDQCIRGIVGSEIKRLHMSPDEWPPFEDRLLPEDGDHFRTGCT